MSWDVREGDCLELLSAMPDCSVQCCVTSPPYWGLRDYGHDGQLGLEATPDEFVANLVAVFAEVRRVLRDDGTLWLNLGDSYAGSWGAQGRTSTLEGGLSKGQIQAHPKRASRTGSIPVGAGYKAKDLIGVPWLTAFALRADGWFLRSEIIWAKPNPMPESVRDRPTKAHEQVFLLSKSPRYFYDADAVREEGAMVSGESRGGSLGRGPVSEPTNMVAGFNHSGAGFVGSGHRNKRTVWTVSTKPFSGAHFATFPPKLIEPMILAGSRPVGAMIEPELVETPTGERAQEPDPSLTVGRAGMSRPRGVGEGTRPITRVEQMGYAKQMKASSHRKAMESEAGPAFAHYVRTDRSGARPVPAELLEAWIGRGWVEREQPPEPTPADPSTSVVLDPFSGSGTTGMVALRHDRSYIGLELNPEYAAMSRDRIRDDAPLLNTGLEAA